MSAPWRGLRATLNGATAGGHARTIVLALAIVLAAATWISAAHIVVGTIRPQSAFAEAVSDIVPIIVIVVVGTAIGSRRARYLERTLTALQASEARARELIEEAGDGILISEASGRYVEANPVLCRMLGYSREQLLGMQAGDLTAVDDPVGNEGMDKRLAEATGEMGILVQRRYRKSDGTSLPVEVRFKVLPDGRQQRNVRDVSERMRAEEALRESEEQFREAFERASIGMALVGLDGRWLKVNPALVQMLGYSEDELRVRSFQEITHPDDLEADLALVRAMLAGSIPSYRMDKRYIHRDGHIVYATLSVSLARNADGQPRHFVSQISDRSAEADLVLEAQVRIVLAEGLQNVPADASLEQASDRICHDLAALPWVDFAAVEAFLGDDDATVVANWARDGFPTRVGDHLSGRRARYLQERAAKGPWADLVRFGDGPDDFALAAEAGLAALAYSPIGHADSVLGVLIVGTRQADFARTLVEKMPGMVAFGTTSSALLGERLEAHRRRHKDRAALEHEMAIGAFHPVFQPIVDLESGEVVGYEALTRFDSGQRPDLCFADAWSVGLGPELEIATLVAAVEAAKRLASGVWLDLNVSPRLLADPERLRAVLRAADRPLVLEVTEHEVIEDYDVVREAIRELGSDIRLAVDDAGAGVANFGHIIDLRPDFVKLDIGLVRRVNANLGRQAMVVGMRHFARTAGCRLVAEGVETVEEARTLTALGVEFGQGYLFGHPEPVEMWTAAATAG